MRILTVLAHPSTKSFNHALAGVIHDVAAEKGHDAETVDLYKLKFNPVLSEADMEAFSRGAVPKDIARQQEEVKGADVIAFVHPVWWFGPPAILKGWVERVFSYGFAYGHDTRGVRPLLAGKKLILVNTTGAAEADGFQATGFGPAMELLADRGVFAFVGLEPLLRRTFYSVPAASDSDRREMLATLRADLGKIL